MTKQEWLDQFRKHKDRIISCVQDYHPASSAFRSGEEFEITAPNAQIACDEACAAIRAENDRSPVLRLKLADMKDDVTEISRILNQAWFGVPESRGCWGITGFSEICDLISDPPDDIEYAEDE